MGGPWVAARALELAFLTPWTAIGCDDVALFCGAHTSPGDDVMMRRVIHSLHLALLMTAGCSLLVGTDGFTDAAADAGSSDVDATVADKRPTLVADAGELDADASALADAAPPPPFCKSFATEPLFCTTFDSDRLETNFLVNGATLDATRYVTPSNSLLASMAPLSDPRYQSVARDLSMTPASIEVNFKIRLETLAAATYVEVMRLELLQGARTCSLLVVANNGRWELSEYCISAGTPDVSVVHPTGRGVSLQTWTKIMVAASFAAPRTYTMTIDDTLIFNELPLDAATSTGLARVNTGIAFCSAGQGPVELNIDDLAIHAHP